MGASRLVLGSSKKNKELYDLRKLICLRKSRVFVKNFSLKAIKMGGAWHALSAMLL